MHKTHYSAAELAVLKLPGFPTTARRWSDLVRRESWPYREEKSRGRNGIRREHLPPEPVAKLIANRGLAPMHFLGEARDVTLTVTVSFEQAGKILCMLRRGRRG